MTFSSPGAILVKIGPFAVRWYGLMIAFGFLIATNFALAKAKKWNIDHDKMMNCILTAFIGGILGARLYYVALMWHSYFRLHSNEVFAVWNGGLSIHGGLIGGILALIIYCRTNKLQPLQAADLIACSMPLAQAIGRWGNFFNSELFGRPVPDTFPIKLFIAPEHRGLPYLSYSYFHPTFLYESAWDLSLFMILYFLLADKLRRYPGLTTSSFIALYSIGRMLVEPLRTDSIMYGSIQTPMIASAVSLVLASIASIVFIIMGTKRKSSTAGNSTEQEIHA